MADTDGARVGILEKAACNIGSLNEFQLGGESDNPVAFLEREREKQLPA